MTPRRWLALLLLGCAALLAILAGRLFLRPPRPPAPAAPGELTAVELPPPRYDDVDRLRAFQRAGADRFRLEEIEEKLEGRFEILLAFLRSPPATADQIREKHPRLAEALSAEAWSERLAPASERWLHEGTGVRVYAGDFSPAKGAAPSAAGEEAAAGVQATAGAQAAAGVEPAAGAQNRRLRGPLEIARGVAELIQPLAALEHAAIKVVRIEERPRAGPRTEVLYQLAGQGSDGMPRQWNGRWILEWTPELALSSIEPLDSTRVVLSAQPFHDVSPYALGGLESYREQLRPGLDYFRDRMDAASGIDVYGHHGIAAGDLDGDGREDLYLAEPGGLPNRILRNRGDGKFDDISSGSGADLLDSTSQPLIIDLDNDGDQDLFLVGEDGLSVLVNDGRGRFAARPSGAAGLDSERATMICAAAADYDLDGWVDVYIGSYVFWRGASNRLGSRLPLPYHDARNGAANFLLQNVNGGSFRNVTAESGLNEGNDRFTFACAWGDYDADGWPDLAVANDFGKKNLYHNRGNGTFTETTAAAGAEDLGAGMSAAWEDYDGDGRLDLCFGNMFSTAGLRVTAVDDFKPGSALRSEYQKHARGNTLLRNRGDGTFDDVTAGARAGMGRWSWSSDFFDFDLDGREDLYIANGFVTNPDSRDL